VTPTANVARRSSFVQSVQGTAATVVDTPGDLYASISVGVTGNSFVLKRKGFSDLELTNTSTSTTHRSSARPR
jgi:hypothetical protein